MTHSERVAREDDAVLKFLAEAGPATARNVANVRIASVPEHAYGLGYDRARLILNRLAGRGRVVRSQEKRQRGIRPEWVYSRVP